MDLRIDMEAVDVIVAAALGLAALDREAQTLEGLVVRLVFVPGPPAAIGVIEDVGVRRDLVSVVYRDDRERTAVSIMRRPDPLKTVARNETLAAAEDNDGPISPGALDDGKPIDRPSVGAPEDFFTASSFTSAGPVGLVSLGPAGLLLIGLRLFGSRQLIPIRKRA